MPSTTHAQFGHDTEAPQVAQAFAGEIKGKNILVTGVSPKSIGYTTVEALASHSPANIIIAGRTPSKLEQCIATLKSKNPNVAYHALTLDLSSQSAARDAAATVLSWDHIPKLDILINFAGIMGIPERTLTPEGIELHLATNHIGHFLLTCHLMPKLIAAGGARVISVSSGSPQMAGFHWSDPTFTKPLGSLPEAEQPAPMAMKFFGAPANWKEIPYVPIEGYNQSKVANVLFAVGLKARVFKKHGVLAIAVHPGVTKSELGREYSEAMRSAVDDMMASGKGFHWQSIGSAAATGLVAALDPKLAVDIEQKVEGRQENYGAFMMDCQITEKGRADAVSSEAAERLWKLSEELVKENFKW